MDENITNLPTNNTPTQAQNGDAGTNAQNAENVPNWLPERLERAKRSALNSLAAELGFSSVDELKATIAKPTVQAESPDPAPKKAQKNDELAEIRDALQMLRMSLENEKKARQEAERTAMIAQVAQKHGIPAQLAERLRGNTIAELEQDAVSLAAALPKPQIQTFRSTTGLVAGQNAPTLAQQIKAAMGGNVGSPSPFFDPDVHRAKGGGVRE